MGEKKNGKNKGGNTIVVKTNGDKYFETAIRTAVYFGYKDGGLKTARRELSLKRQPYLKRLKVLRERKEKLDEEVNDLKELKKKKTQINAQYQVILNQMHENTKTEREVSNYYNELVKMLEDDVRDSLREADLYKLLFDVHPELQRRVEERLKGKKSRKKK